MIGPSQFDKLGLLLRSADLSAAPLCHSTPFFANSDPAMPAAPVPASKVLNYLKESIHTASYKEEFPGANGPQGGDVGMTDAPSSPSSSSGSSSFSNGGLWPRDWQPQGVTSVDGVTKMSVLKGESNIENGVIRVSSIVELCWQKSLPRTGKALCEFVGMARLSRRRYIW